jgi:hypothetical protein
MIQEKRIRYYSTKKISAADYRIKCFICGNKATTTSSNENDDSIDYMDYYKDKSHHHAYICQSYLKREDGYEAYQPALFSPNDHNKYLK